MANGSQTRFQGVVVGIVNPLPSISIHIITYVPESIVHQ